MDRVTESPPKDFVFDWPNPSDANLTWFREAEHYPHPLTPLSIDFSNHVLHHPNTLDFLHDLFNLSPAESIRAFHPQGFVFFNLPPEPDTSFSLSRISDERRERILEQVPNIFSVWQNELEPQAQAVCNSIKLADHDSMSTQELAVYLEDSMKRAADAYSLTFVAATPMFRCSIPLVEFCEAEFQGEGEALAGTLMEGFSNETSLSQTGLWRLAQLAEKSPGVRRALLDWKSGDLFENVSHIDGGQEFTKAFQKHQDRYGWRLETWDELSLPTWREDSTPALRQIQRYITGEDVNPRSSFARSARHRRQLTQQLQAQLQGSPQKLQRFNALLETSRQYVPVRESRALWQLSLGGAIRRLSLAMGAKLHAGGLIDTANDVFYLRIKEIQTLANGSSGTDYRSLVAERRRDRDHWLYSEPPFALGAVPEFPPHSEQDDHLIRGQAASRGVVTARAKVVISLQDAGKFERGDVLVCRSTSPAWTPLLARASAVVADTGGALAHCAIVAREYAIPCVVGASGATQRIQDDMIITVDGGEGVVRL